MDKRRFEFLEHTADAYIAAYGKDLTEAFENAALAMFEVMTEVEKVTPQIKDRIEAEGKDEYALLYNWLEAILVKSEIDKMLYSKFRIVAMDRTSKDLKVKGKIWGEKFDPKKHLQKVGVKAVTYHRMEIAQEPQKTTVKFILDI